MRDRFVESAPVERGEYRGIALEAAYYRKNWFLYALVFFLIGTLAASACGPSASHRAGTDFLMDHLASTAPGLIYCTIAIVKRCIIMQRPPVGNLYDTIIFIATTVVLFALIVEWLTAAASPSASHPSSARRSSCSPAVTNSATPTTTWTRWSPCSTRISGSPPTSSPSPSATPPDCSRVPFRRLRPHARPRPRWRRQGPAPHRSPVRSMACCVSRLFLSLVGTVLGGIWANYSWGRFWGWDPKENGALLIVLWTLAILHARLGGHIREWGIHLASIFTAIVVTFSWWHVNFLGVGLHNYGFTAGKNTIWAFYGDTAAHPGTSGGNALANCFDD
jgi:hypothetical protein